MISIKAVVDTAGLLRNCEVRGHAEAGPVGGDIVCAAVSVLARTAGVVLSGRPDVESRAAAPERGVFTLETRALSGEGKAFLAAVGAFLLEGLGSVAREYPKKCWITIEQLEE